jgi:hypothetical protein
MCSRSSSPLLICILVREGYASSASQVIDRPYGLRVATCNRQLPAARNPESTVHVFFQLPVPGFKGRPVCAGSFPSVAKAELRLDRHHHLTLALRVGIVGNGHRGTAQLLPTTVRLTENTETQNTTDPRAVRRCALGLRLTTGLSHFYPALQSHGLQNPAGCVGAFVGTSSPPTHQPTRTSAHPQQ